jgi:hypothetical protein
MRDEDFAEFINEFGEATHHQDVPNQSIHKWRGKLPEQLLEYWQQEGWNGYADGLFWTVNPDDFEDLADEWLADTPLEQLDSFHIIGRSAFGELYACGQRCGPKLKILAPVNALIALAKELQPKDADTLNFQTRGFFGGRMLSDGDLKDESGKPLFARALEKLGPLEPDEMYGFEPAIVTGGKMVLENLRKVKLDQHLSILRQLAAPTMPFRNIDIDQL